MQRFAAPRVAARVFDRPLALDPTRLKLILEGVGPRIVFGAFDDDGPAGPSAEDLVRERLAAVVGGERIVVHDGIGEYALTPQGVAVIPIVGVLTQRFDWLAAWCGFCTYDALRLTFDHAMNNGAVRAVMLDVDSPGGEVNGMLEIAEHMLRARKIKPLWACANPWAASAAYALAGSAERVVLPRMGYVGSIGMFAVHVDRSGQDAAAGLKYTAVYSGKRKIDGWDHAPLGEEAFARLQADLDEGRRRFAALVAAQGRLSAPQALATEAQTYMDDEAVQMRLADEVMDFDAALASLNELAAGRPANAAARLAAVSSGGPDMTKKATAGGDPAPQDDKKQGDPAPADDANKAPASEPGKDDPVAAAQTESARVTAIVELCTLAKRPSAALGFIKSQASVDAVRAQLAKMAADAVDRDPIDTTAPQSGAPRIDVAAIYAARNNAGRA